MAPSVRPSPGELGRLGLGSVPSRRRADAFSSWDARRPGAVAGPVVSRTRAGHTEAAPRAGSDRLLSPGLLRGIAVRVRAVLSAADRHRARRMVPALAPG